MRIENNRTLRPPALHHRCGFYSSPRHLLNQLAPTVAAALARGTTVALAGPDATRDGLHAMVGESDRLLLLEPPGRAAHSGQTVAARRALELRELTVTHGPVMMINEHMSEYDGADGSFWTELDAAFNVALADLPVELTCFYPEMPLHQQIVDGAHCNHPELLVGGHAHHNPAFQSPQSVLSRHPAPAPELLGAPDLDMGFGAWQLNEVRATVEDALIDAGYGRSRAEDVVLAVNEVATNAVEHGTSEARLCLWISRDGAVCEVHDGGPLRDPLPGLIPPHSSVPRGRGVWIARQICDSLHVWADDRGTHVRMHAGHPV